MNSVIDSEERYERVSKTFSYSDRLDDKPICWVMGYVKVRPFSHELSLEEGESVRTTRNTDLSMTVDIKYKP
jgi:hypothetical protein